MNRRRSGQSDDEGARWARTVLGRGAHAPASQLPVSGRPGPADETWRETWDGLELPAAPAAPAGFARRVARAAAAERELASASILGAAWMRAAAAAALLAGIALGSTLALSSGLGGGLDELPSVDAIAAEESGLDDESWAATLSEEYLVALAADEATSQTSAAGPGEASE
jgi:hypothetical protein